MTTKAARKSEAEKEVARLRKALRAILAALGKERQGDHERAWIAAADRAMHIAEDALGPQVPPPPPLTIEYPLPDRKLCGNGKAAGIQRGKLVQEARANAEIVSTASHRAARDRLGLSPDLSEPWFAPGKRVAVRVHVRRDPLWSTRALDDDNMQRGLKPTIDSLQDSLIVANDRQCFFDGPVTWATGPPYIGGVILTLRQVEDE